MEMVNAKINIEFVILYLLKKKLLHFTAFNLMFNSMFQCLIHLY